MPEAWPINRNSELEISLRSGFNPDASLADEGRTPRNEMAHCHFLSLSAGKGRLGNLAIRRNKQSNVPISAKGGDTVSVNYLKESAMRRLPKTPTRVPLEHPGDV